MNSPSQDTNVPANRCPSCNAEIKAESTAFFGDMQCPSCSKKLWFLVAADSARFFEYDTSAELQDRAISFIAERMEVDKDELAANPGLLNDQETDSLEALELLMDLEEELGLV